MFKLNGDWILLFSKSINSTNIFHFSLCDCERWMWWVRPTAFKIQIVVRCHVNVDFVSQWKFRWFASCTKRSIIMANLVVPFMHHWQCTSISFNWNIKKMILHVHLSLSLSRCFASETNSVWPSFFYIINRDAKRKNSCKFCCRNSIHHTHRPFAMRTQMQWMWC